LLRLVEKSLVIADGSADGAERYRLLETLRQYAQEKLVARGEGEARHGRHADYFTQRLADVTGGLWVLQLDADRMQWLNREYDNLRAALHWARERGDAERGLRLVQLLDDFWQLRGYLFEGRKRVQEILELPRAQTPTAARAAALEVLAGLVRRQTDYSTARSLFEEALAIYRTLGDARQVAIELMSLANVSYLQADFAGARAYTDQARATSAWADDPLLREWTNFLLGSIALHEGDYPSARRLLEANTQSRPVIEESLSAAYHIGVLGWVALAEGNLVEARSRFATVFAIRHQFGDVVLLVHGLEGSASLAVARGQFLRAVCLGGAAASQRRRVGAPNGPAWAALLERWLGRARDVLSAEAFATAWEKGLAMTLEQAVACALEEIDT
jgi:tetratricopeptide (TPR) repeat protein